MIHVRTGKKPMKVVLIYPPTTDPTAPYISVPILTGYLRARGLDVLPVDANVEAYDQLLRRQSLSAARERIERRLKGLKKKKFLGHSDQLAWINLHKARSAAHATCDAIDEAVAVMRDRSGVRFYDPVRYEKALITIENALDLVSAAWTPLTLDFAGYRTPFSLLDPHEIVMDAAADHNPFHGYFCGLAERLAQYSPAVIGISMAFTNQVQCAFALAMLLRRMIPGAYLTTGGAAITQILLRLTGRERDNALGPFHSAVLFEGEKSLLGLISAVERGDAPRGIITGERDVDPGGIPAPDFNGLPLDKYLSPEPVLPYDTTRGCYWGKCAFCHYGLTESGTAAYRERPAGQVLDHLQKLSDRHRCRVFYFSQDTIHPRNALRLSRAFSAGGTPWKWASDIRPEPLLTGDCCRELARGGALAFSLGIESADERVLRLINKGVRPDGMRRVINNVADAGIAAECMTFTGFPTETATEALATIRFLESLRDRISLFICGEFHLVPGSLVAAHPEKYGIADLWTVTGDAFIKTLFYTESGPPLSLADIETVDRAVAELSRSFRLHRYPWAGSLSTAHTLLWYNRFGPAVFRDLARNRSIRSPREPAPPGAMRAMALQALENEAAIWQAMVGEKRAVSRRAYGVLAGRCPRWKI